MKVHSCGAILYTIFNSKVYIVLGKEHGDWFPFKGKCENDESYEEAAIREIEEETCRLVKLSSINLDCHYSTPRKFYHIGLVFVPYTFISEFYARRKHEEDEKCLEKTQIKIFPISHIKNYKFHQISSIPISYYENFLLQLQIKIDRLQIIKNNERSSHSIDSVDSMDSVNRITPYGVIKA